MQRPDATPPYFKITFVSVNNNKLDVIYVNTRHPSDETSGEEKSRRRNIR